MNTPRHALIVAIVLILGSASCAPFSGGESEFTLSIEVPGFPATDLPGASKALSPYTAYVVVEVSSPEGGSWGPFRAEVVVGLRTNVTVRTPLLSLAHIAVRAFDADDVMISQGSVDAPIDLTTPINVPLLPQAFGNSAGSFEFPAPATLAVTVAAGKVAFYHASCVNSGDYLVRFANYDRHWIRVYDAATGAALDDYGSIPANGWGLFRGADGQDLIIAVAPPAGGEHRRPGPLLRRREIRPLRRAGGGRVAGRPLRHPAERGPGHGEHRRGLDPLGLRDLGRALCARG